MMPADFWERVDRSGGQDACHPWKKGTNRNGYGKLAYPTRTVIVYAHRLAYELAYGPIPKGMTVDHECHNGDASCVGGPACSHRRCCNPAHLVLRPCVDNARTAAKTRATCRAGHPWTPESTVISPTGRRRCRTCANERQRGRRRSGRARAVEAGRLLRQQCANGHPLTEESTYLRPDGYRECRKCRNVAVSRSKAKMR